MALPKIEWEDSYPTEESVEAFEVAQRDSDNFKGGTARWVYDTLEECADNCCASFSEENAEDFFKKPTKKVFFSTGGWSGAEEIIGLIEGDIILSQYTVQWNRGGHYVFEFNQSDLEGNPPEQP